MYSVTQYVSAAIHNGTINTEDIVNRYEDNHKAKCIELGIDEAHIYKEAKKANSRNTIVNFLMIIPAPYILTILMESLVPNNYSVGDLILNIFPALTFISIIVLIKEISINNYIRKIAKSTPDQNLKHDFNNVIISGGYSPFTGYGFDLDSWSFTINLKRSSTGDCIEPKEADVEELLQLISTKLKSTIKDIDLSDKIFVNGKDIRHNKLIMKSVESKPTTFISEEIIKSYIGRTDENIRHYRVISIPMCSNQMYMTIFIRFTIIGEQLFAESRFFLLPPLEKNLMVLDEALVNRGVSYYSGLIFSSYFKSLYFWVLGPMQILSIFTKACTEMSHSLFGDPENKKKNRDVRYNYGNVNSLRESWSKLNFHRFFQMLDKDLNYKISQHIIINSISDYLESKGISTEDIKERQTTILNSGVLITGGKVKADNMAVGSGATLNK